MGAGLSAIVSPVWFAGGECVVVRAERRGAAGAPAGPAGAGAVFCRAYPRKQQLRHSAPGRGRGALAGDDGNTGGGVFGRVPVLPRGTGIGLSHDF